MNKDNVFFDPTQMNFFPEFVYFLGFCWADGTIDNNGYHNKVAIEITSDDAVQLKPIFDKVGIWTIYKRLRKIKIKGVLINSKECTRFRLSNKIFVNFLVNLGYKNKSNTNPEKVLEIIPEHLKIYFFRGLLDGDGCFCETIIRKDYRVRSIAISSGITQNWSSVEDFYNKHNIYYSIQKQTRNNMSGSTIIVRRKKDIKKLINIIYPVDDGIYLPRKYHKAISFIK